MMEDEMIEFELVRGFALGIYCQFVVLNCFVTSDTFVTKSIQSQDMVHMCKIRVYYV